MYVTLEPCAHTGRQPPCVEAILEAGIGRVVIGSDDPSEKASGRGPGMLRDGGVEVELAAGEEATAARLLNQPFRKHARTGLPLVTLKLAMSLDGQTTTAEGDSPWISGPESRELVHRWRAESDAIAVGIGTVLADDPLLTARPPARSSFARQSGSNLDRAAEVRQPLRVVFDRRARLPLDSQLLQTLDLSPLLVVISRRPMRAGRAAEGARRSRRRRHRGCPRRPRSPRHHQPLPRGRSNACRRFHRGRPGGRGAHLRRADPALRRPA